MLLLEADTNHIQPPRKRLSGNGNLKETPVRVDHHLSTSSTRLRSNLLVKLGIPPSATAPSTTCGKLTKLAPGVSLLGNVKVVQRPLKTDEVDYKREFRPLRRPDTVFQALGSLWTQPPAQRTEPESSNASESSLPSAMEQDSERRVRFNPDVKMALIPMRDEYSSRIRRFLWDTPEQMRAQIVRNTVEFTADGWDWHSAPEETEHFYNPHNGEYIHPVHMEIAQMPPEEQEDVCPPDYVNPALATTLSS